MAACSKKTPHDTTGRCTCGRGHCIQKSWAKPSNHTVSKTEPPNSLVHISTFEVIRLILGEATKLPLRLPEWLLEHAVPLSKLCVPIYFFLWIKTCDGHQTWQLSPNLLWIGLHHKKNTPCCHPASRAVWVVAVCDHDGFLCKVGLSWLRLWPNERQVSNYTNGEWKWLEHLGTLWWF